MAEASNLSKTAGSVEGVRARQGDRPVPISVIGLGIMGQVLARTFLSHGHPVTVWNRSAAKGDALAAQGATSAATVAEAVSASRLVIVCVTDYPAARAILDPVGEALAGRVLINLTTGRPAEARETAEWAARHGATYIDGAIMAIPEMIGLPESVLFYSGSPEAFEAHRATLTLLGGATTYVGDDPGMAALYDFALLSMMYALLGGFFHGLALIGTAKVDAATLMPYLTRWLPAVVSWLPALAADVDARRYTTDVSTLDINKAALANIILASREAGVSADVLQPMLAMVERRVAAGGARDGLPSLIETLRGTGAAPSQA